MEFRGKRIARALLISCSAEMGSLHELESWEPTTSSEVSGSKGRWRGRGGERETLLFCAQLGLN